MTKDIEETGPPLPTFSCVPERVHVANQNQAIATFGQKDIQPFRRKHEAYFRLQIAPSQGYNNDVTFFTLIIV